MRKLFYIFRHGETDYNTVRRWQGSGIDIPLNATGVAQAQNLASLLRDKGIQIIYSSPLKRALQTAEIVAAGLGVPVKIVSELREGCLGETEGMLKQEVALKFPDIFQQWYDDANDMDIAFPGGETKNQIQQRMLGAVERLLQTPQQVIGISSHSASIRYFLMKFGHKPHAMKNTALFRLSYEDGIWDLQEL